MLKKHILLNIKSGSSPVFLKKKDIYFLNLQFKNDISREQGYDWLARLGIPAQKPVIGPKADCKRRSAVYERTHILLTIFKVILRRTIIKICFGVQKSSGREDADRRTGKNANDEAGLKKPAHSEIPILVVH